MEGKLHDKKIMWIEDDQFLSGIIAQKLSSHGGTLTHSSNGEDGLAMVKKEIPDVLILDILLPGISGFEVLESIKTDPAVKHVPVVMFSNLGDPEDIKKAKDLGATKFLVKATLIPDELVNELAAVL
jgi:CheY-like chemotaxis protein